MNNYAFAWLFPLLVFISSHSTAQTPLVDSLKKKIVAESNDTEKLSLLITLCDYHQSMHRDSLYAYALLATQLAAKTKTKRSAAAVDLANAYLRMGKTDSALAITEAHLPLNPVTNPATRNLHFTLAALKADCYGDASNYTDALAELYKIINLAETYNDSLVLARNMNTVGVIQYNLDHVAEAFRWYFRGLSFSSGDPHFAAATAALYINLAETYRWIDKTDSAEFYIDKAIPLCTKSQNLFFLGNAVRVKASIYKQKKDYIKAEETMLASIDIKEKLEGKRLYSNEQIALANIYMNAGLVNKAISLLTKALAEDKGDAKADALILSYYNTLAKCYKQKGDNEKYEETLEKIIKAKDAFYEANSAMAIAELQTKYEVQKKEKTIIEQKLNLTIKNYWLYGSALFAVMGMIIVWLAFKNYRRKQNIKMQLALQEEKRIAFQSVMEAEEQERKRIAADLHDNIGAYASAIRADVEKISDSGFVKNNVSLHNLQQHSQEIINSLRDTIWVLNKENITITGIGDRIKNYINKLQPTYSHIKFQVDEDIEQDVRLSSKHALSIFRIVQEAIHNALKHSKAANLNVVIHSAANIKLTIADDGIGMHESSNTLSGNGLLNMKARAKEADMQLEIVSLHNKGTRLELTTTTN